MLWLSAMPRRLLLLALTSAACFSDDPPQLTAGVTSDSTGSATDTDASPTTGLPTTGALTSTTTTPIEPTSTTDEPTTGEPTTGEPVDDCEGATPVCPDGPTKPSNGGLEPIDRCNFPLKAGTEWDTHGLRLDQLAIKLPNRTIDEILVDLDADALGAPTVPGVDSPAFAMRWDEDDFAVRTWWRPQGLASGEGDDREALLVSWRFDQSLTELDYDKGVRITLVDLGDPADIRYRHILLVEPVAGDPVDFKPVPINAAAGGLAWYGDTLYVADTASLRVFDLSRVLVVQALLDQVGHDPNDDQYHGGQYPYAAVQVGAYHLISTCNKPRLSTLTLDRSASPPQLIVAEYCDDNTCNGPDDGRLFAWPIDPVTGRLPADTTWPSAAAYAHQTQIRGAARSDGDLFVATSLLPLATGALHVLAGGGPSVLHDWIDTPTAVMASGDQVWGMSQEPGARYVFAVPRASYE